MRLLVVEGEKRMAGLLSKAFTARNAGLAMIRALAFAIVFPIALFAQVPVTGRLLDPSETPVGGVAVALRQGDNELSAITSESGQFRFERVPPGEYELTMSVAGFDPIRRQIRVARQPARELVIHLRLALLKAELDVREQERQVSVAPGQNADAISVERTMLDNLPILDNNYLNALARFLNPGTPGDAGTSIVVDGMESRNVGVTASAIQEIRINNNPYTVEYPRWSRRRIEVITKSSADSYHGTFNFLVRDYRLNAREALAVQRPQEQRRILEGSLFGPVGRSRNTSFLFSGAREQDDLVAVVFAQSPFGPLNDNVPTPQVNSVASLRISRQWNENQAAFWQVNFQDRWQNNLGAGGTTLREAAAQNRFREDEFIFNHRALVNPRFLSQFRILLGRYWSPTRSNRNAAKVIVTDAFTGGGAQADRLSTEFHTSISWLLTQTIGRHTLKYGFNVPDWSRRGLRDESNRIGTLSYASLADVQAALPFAAVLQRGDPRIVFIEKNLGAFFQDEWQIRPSLSLSGGFRYDWQNYFGDRNNLQPRLALAYAPGKSRKWVLRAGAGSFFERSGPGPIFDILRFDGARLRRYVLSGAAVPQDPISFGGVGFPASVHRLETGAELPGVIQFGASIERQLSKRSLLSVGYTGARGVQQFRSRDGNAPLPPSFARRPEPERNVLRFIESAGRLESNSLEVTLRGDIAPRVSGMAQYVYGKAMSDTGGINWFPASSFAPAGEWGRADTDRRHQFNFLGTVSVHRWLNFGVSASMLTAPPFNITTGRDDNQDGMAVDRPAGVTRNTGSGPNMIGLDVRWYREFRLAPSKLAPSKRDKSPSATISADAFNLLNRVNYQNYVGALTSPFFGRAVATLPARRLQLGFRYQ
ncbi:MAG TPA: hypothetical protein DEH78_30595, partial [Solibacterales bacterium]|nr:hypothetical protein [Bryobacterales bacterium]